MEIYCNDCELAVCIVCFLVHHKKHDGSEVTEVVDKLRKRIEIDIGKIDQLSVERGKELESLHKRMKNLSENAAKSKNTILRRGEEMKRLVDEHVSIMLVNLDSEVSKKTKEVEIVKEKLLFQKICLDSYKFYAEDVLIKASSSYVASPRVLSRI